MRKRISYSQNFLKNRSLVADLIERSSITCNDLVYEIGAGQGIITEELLKKSNRVIAFEIDKNLFGKLSQRFKGNKSLELRNENFLTSSLPAHSYKVFSNIPFNITADVIRKLIQSANPPEDSYLIVQNEAAKKFIGKPYTDRNSQMAVLLKPWFYLEVLHKFNRQDFYPIPQVDIVLLRVKKLEKPLVSEKLMGEYQDFVVYVFNQFKPNIIEGLSAVFGRQAILSLSKIIGFSPTSKPSELDYRHWLNLFNSYSQGSNKKSIVKGSYVRILEQQKGLKKINRTRVDKNWKQYKVSS